MKRRLACDFIGIVWDIGIAATTLAARTRSKRQPTRLDVGQGIAFRIAIAGRRFILVTVFGPAVNIIFIGIAFAFFQIDCDGVRTVAVRRHLVGRIRLFPIVKRADQINIKIRLATGPRARPFVKIMKRRFACGIPGIS